MDFRQNWILSLNLVIKVLFNLWETWTSPLVNRVIIATSVTGGETLNDVHYGECISQAGHIVINSGGERDFQKV